MAPASLKNVASYGNGWQTTCNTPQSFEEHLSLIRSYAAEEEREIEEAFEACFYYNINVSEDREAALDEAKEFLATYYYTDYDRERLQRWVADGSPEECAERIRAFIDPGATAVTLQMPACAQPEEPVREGRRRGAARPSGYPGMILAGKQHE